VLESEFLDIIRSHLSVKIDDVCHLQRNTFLISSSGLHFVCKLHLKDWRLEAIESCLNLLGNQSTKLTFAFPSLLFKDTSHSTSISVFSYVEGIPLASERAPLLYSDFCSIAREIESIPLRALSFPELTFYDELCSEIVHVCQSDRFLHSFLPRAQSGIPHPVLSLAHGDFSYQNILLSPAGSLKQYSIIDWEYCGLCYQGFDYAWLSTLAHHAGWISLADISSPSDNHLHFMYLGYLRLIYRLRSVSRRTEVHMLHELKVLSDFRDFLIFFGMPEAQYF